MIRTTIFRAPSYRRRPKYKRNRKKARNNQKLSRIRPGRAICGYSWLFVAIRAVFMCVLSPMVQRRGVNGHEICSLCVTGDAQCAYVLFYSPAEFNNKYWPIIIYDFMRAKLRKIRYFISQAHYRWIITASHLAQFATHHRETVQQTVRIVIRSVGN